MIRTLVALAAMAPLSACASNYVATPFIAGPERIGKVAVVDDPVPEKMSAAEIASVGSNFGLIGALIDAGVQDSRQDALTGALDTISFDAEDALQTYVVDALAQREIEATLLDGPQRQKHVFLTDYPDAGEDVQAYFDLVLSNYGYVSAGPGQPWRPTADAMVRLVSRSDQRVLLENRIAYNTMYAPGGVITLTPNPEYAFQNREEMVSNPERLADGLRDALQQVAETAAKLIQ